jgi:hypothetical protein
MKRVAWVVFLGFAACAGCVRTPGYQFPGVKGQVLDGMTKAPIAGAKVSVTPFGGSGLVLSSESDANGRFEVRQTRRHFYYYPPPGALEAWVDAHMDVSAAGYESQRLPLLDLSKRVLPDTSVSLTRR